MKLAVALHDRADLQTRISQLRERLLNNAKVQEGDTISEEPEELLKELNQNCVELESLIRRINHTNNQTMVGEASLVDLLAQKDVLTLKLSILRAFLEKASARLQRYSSSELRISSTVNIAEKQKEVDHLAKQLRELDTRIQEINWTTELL
ncbi:MAG: DIP1984 family protein [Anaerotruncus sp.]|jgi:chromosome segregation ATPase|nr:DIP1984 family protein [Anaerotruncus sp.]